MPPSARLALMGALELRCEGIPQPLATSAQRLLAYVALQSGPVGRVYVAGQLWLESSEPRAAASLRSALWRLHRTAGEVVVATGRELSLAPWVSVDVHEVGALADRALAGDSLSREEAAELFRSDDVLPGWYEEWVGIERERFRQLRLHALERLCENLSEEGRHAEALEAGLAALRAEPLRESAHRAMIGMHLAEGNVGEALRQYDTCERLMARALGVRPSQQTERLVEDGVAARRVLGGVR